MFKRTVSGLILAAIGIAALIVPDWIRLILLTILMLLANYEMLGAIRQAGYKPLVWPGYVFSALLCLTYVFLGADALWGLAILIILAAFAQRVFSKNVKTIDVFAGLAVFIYPLMPFLFILLTAMLEAPLWLTILLSGLVSACFTDVFALFSGMLFGKHKLSPEISPKKTIEGAIGGFICAVLGGALLWVLQGYWRANYSLWIYLLSAALGSVAGQIGDLAASSIKREVGIKDFGKLIPGHGGVLDRLDSILFAIPVAYILFRYLT